MDISAWIEKQHLTRQIVIEKKPFHHLLLKNFLREHKAAILKKALCKEPFFQKETDLLKFKQSHDFYSTQNKQLHPAYDFFRSPQLISFISKITKTKLSSQKISIAGSLYEDSDFLLCHDDQLEGRKIAFMYYLSTLEPQQGGALELFSSHQGRPLKIEKRYYPCYNTLLLFTVSPTSFHQVQEVIKAQRLSLSGWFYG